MSEQQEPEPKLPAQRLPDGRFLPGHDGLEGAGKNRIVKEYGEICRALLDRKVGLIEEGDLQRQVSLWEASFTALLEPILGRARKDGPLYLVNHATILGTLEHLARYGFGAPPKSEDEDGPSGGGTTIVLHIHADQPAASVVDVTPAAARPVQGGNA